MYVFVLSRISVCAIDTMRRETRKISRENGSREIATVSKVCRVLIAV